TSGINSVPMAKTTTALQASRIAQPPGDADGGAYSSGTTETGDRESS
ncbi:MAG: hypothetical protein JWM57_91, partial [Phycisphaerales bacterium]|nr:hypothetical protein [Phycisphaerales bacterium]